MSYLRELRIKTSSRISFVDINDNISNIIKETGVKEGEVMVFIPHTTAAVTINENADPDVIGDLKEISQRLVPWQGNYKHREGNSAAHMMASLIGASENIIIHRGALVLGTWQGVYVADFDGPRERRVILRIRED